MSTPQSFVVLKLEALSHARTASRMGVALDGSAPFTIDAWLDFDGLCSSAGILSQQDGFNFGIVGEALCLQIPGYPQVLSDPGIHALDEIDWHYVCVTFDGSSVRFYINGQFNSLRSYLGTGTTSPNAFMIGSDLQARARTVRVYNTVLSADRILGNMFNPPSPTNVTAAFDFTQAPPVDTGPNHFPITLVDGAAMVIDVPAVALSGTAYTVPIHSEMVNPGGYQVDPYTVQAWIYVSSTINPQQTIFINSDTETDTGMALFLDWDATERGYRLVSQRGANVTATSLRSNATIPPNSWVNVATTFDGTTLSIYIDGALDIARRFGPIALIRNASNLAIGAGLSQGQAVMSTTFQGYINRVDVWSIALSAAQLAQYMGPPPDIETEGLEAVYDFTASPCRDQVTQAPVGLNDGAVISAQQIVATSSPRLDEVETSLPDFGLEAATIERLRASVDFADFLQKHRDALLEAMESDVLAFAGDAAAMSKIRAAWTEQIRRLTEAPGSLPFWLSSHVVGEDRVLLCHTPSGSQVVYRAAGADFDDCTMWKVTLLFTVVAGILGAIFGVPARLSPRAITYIQNLLANPRIAALLASGRAMSAVTIFALGGTLVSSGAFKELLSMIADLGIWALLRICVKAGLTFLGVGVADVIASLVATAASFVYIYTQQRPASCDPLPTLNLAEIRFNYDPTGSSVDALSIRKNYTTDVAVPEWISGKTDPAASPAAYSIRAVTGKDITIQAKFTASTTSSFSATVQASGGGILGPIDPITVNFSNGVSNPVTIPLKHHTLASGGIQVQNITWVWSYQPLGGAWTPMGSSNHRIYAVLRVPTMPWVQTSGSTQLPWTEILDLACVWAAGRTTAVDVATAITQEVYANLGLSYDTNAGAPSFTDINGADRRFLATKFINYLKGGPSRFSYTNCTDCATIVASFSNILGCNLTESRMWNTAASSGSRGFYCNKIWAIGGTDWSYPFPLKPYPYDVMFSYHEVAWTGASGANDRLFDACLRVDSGPNPWDWINPGTHTPHQPVDMVFTNSPLPTPLPLATPFTSLYYRERLAQNSAQGITACAPSGPFSGTQAGRRQVV